KASSGTFGGQVRLTWNSSPGASGYQVWRSLGVDSGSAVEIAGGVTATSYTDATASAGQVYYYWVAAQYLDGESLLAGPATGYAGNAGRLYVVSAYSDAIYEYTTSGQTVNAAITSGGWR